MPVARTLEAARPLVSFVLGKVFAGEAAAPALRRALLTFVLALALPACASWDQPSSGPMLADLAGQWEGTMDGRLGRGRANLTLQPDGRYAGYLHLDDGDRPFTGTIVTFGHRGGRYAGTDGEGIVTVRRERGHAMLVFVPDGGGARSAFERAK